ncbi:MAG: hypothetical protein ACREDR_19250 [Blastocatellia bacterium]
MNEVELLGLVALGVGICLADWRIGVFVCVVAGFLLDPIRKLMPGEPVYLTALVGVFVAATCLGAFLRGVRFSFRPIHRWNGSLRAPMAVFVGFVILQSGIAYLKTSSPVVPVIGLLAYLSPLPAILVGYYFPKSQEGIIKFIVIYLAISAVMVSGIYLSYAGYDWQLWSSVGEALVTYSPQGEQLTLLSGFFRAPEIAAWHAGASVCLLIVLFMVAPPKKTLRVLIIGAMMFFITALVLTGRRKFLVEIAVFGVVYLSILILFRRRAVKSAVLLFVAVVASFQVYVFLVPDDFKATIEPYYERSAQVGEEGAGRLSQNSIESFQYVIATNGIFGSGAGTGSQGAQYYGGGAQLVGGSAEGGLGKVLAELGLPGLVLLGWLGIAAIRYLWSIIAFVNRGSASTARLTFALAAFLTSNVLVFTAEHQAFGDVFILVMLGTLCGFVLAMPRLAGNGAALDIRRQPRPLQYPDMLVGVPLESGSRL